MVDLLLAIAPVIYGAAVAWTQMQRNRSQAVLYRAMAVEVIQRTQVAMPAPFAATPPTTPGVDALETSPDSLSIPSVSPGPVPVIMSSGRRRWLPYPWLFVLSALGLTVSILVAVFGLGSTFGLLTLDLLELALMFVGIRQAVRLRRWGWVVGIVLFGLVSVLFFGLHGPTTVRAKKEAPAPAAA